ncbi:MAG: lytic murein transglycosylase [Hyphomicrobiaceae bacterium]|nr:lytic murein transglycosylase [Hyphomicrobiaceae bacterium]
MSGGQRQSADPMWPRPKRKRGFCSPFGALAAVWVVAHIAAILSAGPAEAAADPAFRAFIEALWPDARAAGISRATFDRETASLEPDLSLPDLVLPGRDKTGSKGQAEFTVAPQDYLQAKRIATLADEGRALARRHAAILAKVEAKVGVDGPVVLAIWGRETAFGKHRARHDAVRALATLAYVGRRKELFRSELIHALKLIEDKRLKRSEMRASWAGAMGLTQFMPSEFTSSAIDLDGDGRIDLFGSVADALGSAASQLKQKGWLKGLPWGIEVRTGARVDCAHEGPLNSRAIAEWARLGVTRADGSPLGHAHGDAQAYLMSPAGTYGPQFLVTENFKVFRAYNTSDLYALFVGHLADRIAGGGDFRTPWGQVRQLDTASILDIQTRLKAGGFAIEKLDGRIGSETRLRIGLYQRNAGLGVDCWPSAGLLEAMRRRAGP